MKNKITINKICLSLLIISTYALSDSDSLNVHHVPKSASIDRNGIDIISLQPVLSIDTINIGSDLKLTHSIKSFNGGFHQKGGGIGPNRFDNAIVMPGSKNFLDQYSGAIYDSEDRRSQYEGDYRKMPITKIKRVKIGTKSSMFKINEDDSYSPLEDSREMLTKNGNNFEYIDSEGTLYNFKYIASQDVTSSYMESFQTINYVTQMDTHWLDNIEYPNGFKIQVSYSDSTPWTISSINSNNGFQLFYEHTGEHYALSKVISINNIDEVCPYQTYTCALNKAWPAFKFIWPDNDPTELDNLTRSPRTVTLEDPEGTSTSYIHNTHRRSESEVGFTKLYSITRDGQEIASYEYYQPQLTMNINDAEFSNSTSSDGYQPVQLHKYRKGLYEYTYPYRTHDSTVEAKENAETYRTFWGDGIWSSKSYWHEVVIDSFSSLSKIRTYADNSISNKVTSVKNGVGETVSYLYSRSNISKVTNKGTDGSTVVLERGFDTTCTNYKTCNKPNWEVDQNGNRTDYQYHAESGQISKKTLPANQSGIRPETRYFYKQYYARYKNEQGVMSQADSPIWLLDYESTCLTGAASGNGCASTNDELITRYEYGDPNAPNNLFMTGITRTHAGKSQTTCYQYDLYGNQIGVVKPKANKSICY